MELRDPGSSLLMLYGELKHRVIVPYFYAVLDTYVDFGHTRIEAAPAHDRQTQDHTDQL